MVRSASEWAVRASKRLLSERLQVEADGGADVGQGFLVGLPFSDDDPFDSEGVGHVGIGMLLDDDLEVLGYWLSPPLSLHAEPA